MSSFHVFYPHQHLDYALNCLTKHMAMMHLEKKNLFRKIAILRIRLCAEFDIHVKLNLWLARGAN